MVSLAVCLRLQTPLAVTRTAVAQPTPAGVIPTPAYRNMATKGRLFLEITTRDAFEETLDPREDVYPGGGGRTDESFRKPGPYSEGLAAPGGALGPGGLIGGLVPAPLAVAGGIRPTGSHAERDLRTEPPTHRGESGHGRIRDPGDIAEYRDGAPLASLPTATVTQ